MRYLYQPMSHLLNDMFGAYNQLGMWGTGTDPHVWLFQQPTAACRRRCATRQRCQRPEVWEETIDVSNLKPETIEVRSEEGTMVISGVLRGEKPTKGAEGSQEITKRMPLPEGLVTPSLRCYLAGGKIHVLGMVLKSQKSEASTAEKATAKSTEEQSADTKTAKEPAGSVPTQDNTNCPCEGAAIRNCPMRDGCCAQASAQKTDEDVAMDFEIVPEPVCCHDDNQEADDAESLDVETSEPEGGDTDVSVRENGGHLGEDQDEDADNLMEDADGDVSKDADVSKKLEDIETKVDAANAESTAIVPSQHFHKKFNLSGFEPSEMKVSLSGRHLAVTAEHSEEADDFVNFRQYRQTVTLPDDVILADVTSHLSNEGVLEISAPVADDPELLGERILDIKFQ